MAAILLSLTFVYGMDCSALAGLSQYQLEGAIWEMDSGTEDFCKPELNFECTDYAALVSNFGTLISIDDGTMCRFTRRSEQHSF